LLNNGLKFATWKVCDANLEKWFSNWIKTGLKLEEMTHIRAFLFLTWIFLLLTWKLIFGMVLKSAITY